MVPVPYILFTVLLLTSPQIDKRERGISQAKAVTVAARSQKVDFKATGFGSPAGYDLSK